MQTITIYDAADFLSDSDVRHILDDQGRYEIEDTFHGVLMSQFTFSSAVDGCPGVESEISDEEYESLMERVNAIPKDAFILFKL